MTYAEFVAAYPNLDRNVQTGGGCTAWQLPIDEKHFALITCVDDPSVPLPTDETIAVSFYEMAADGDWIWLGETSYIVTWEEAETLIDERIFFPPEA